MKEGVNGKECGTKDGCSYMKRSGLAERVAAGQKNMANKP